MARRFSPAIETVTLTRRAPAVSIDDLAQMLEIDLALGRPQDFRDRLQNALNDAMMQGRGIAR